MREYFEAEMRRLRESGQEFAQAYPELAAQLNLTSLRDWDPYVERLLEGTAYLTAQIQQRIDDDIPEICETFLMQMWPHFLRPFPAATVMQFQAQKMQLQQTLSIPKGTAIHSSALGQQNTYEFRTSETIKINPLEITRVNSNEESDGGTVIKIQLRTTATSMEKLDLSELLLYLHADTSVALHSYYALLTGMSHLQISFPEFPNLSPEKIFGQSIRPSNVSFGDALIPLAGRSILGFHLLQEYFAFRNKYFFVTLHGLDKIKIPNNCRLLDFSIKLKINFPKEYPLQENLLQLNCVPAINLFEKSSEPVRLTPYRTEYPIIPDVNARDTIFLYSVDKVTALDNNSGKRQDYLPLTSFLFRQQSENYYHLTQRQDSKKYPRTFLIVGGGKGLPNATLSCNITALNGHHPRDFLPENSAASCKNLPGFIQVRNIVRPSAMLMQPQRSQYRWALISHLSLNIQGIMKLHHLKEILTLYEWSGRADNQRRIEGLNDLNVKQVRQIYRGALAQGLEFTLTLREEFYFSVADIYLFGMVLHKFFMNYAAVNLFVVTKIRCLPSEQEFVWNSSKD